MERRYEFGSFVLDARHGLLVRDGLPVPIGIRALKVLEVLLDAGGRTLTKSELLQLAWADTVVEESNLTVQVAALRKQLGNSPAGGEWIATVPRVGYRFIGEVLQVAVAAGAAPPVTALAQKLSIAILPFINLSGDPGQEYFADGITEDIITALSRFRWFFVAARNSSFAFKGRNLSARQVGDDLGVRYVLDGTVRKSDTRVRISARLVEVAGDKQIWGDRFDFDLSEMLAMQDQIADRVAGSIEPELLRTESALVRPSQREGSLTAWDLLRRGTYCFHKVARETHLQARELFRQACVLEPELPEAHVWLARVCAGLLAYGWSEDAGMELREGERAAYQAIRLDEKSPYAHYALAIVSVFSGDLGRAIRAGESAVALSPSFALGHLVLGMARVSAGQAASAIGPLKRGLELNPFDPQNVAWYTFLAVACLFAKDTEQALQSATQAVQLGPNWRPGLEIVICCYVSSGRQETAQDFVRQLNALQGPANDALAPLKRHNPLWAASMDALLHEAGVTRSRQENSHA